MTNSNYVDLVLKFLLLKLDDDVAVQSLGMSLSFSFPVAGSSLASLFSMPSKRWFITGGLLLSYQTLCDRPPRKVDLIKQHLTTLGGLINRL